MNDYAELEAIVARFFGAFTTGPGLDERMAALAALFHPRAVISRAGGQPLEVYDVDGFIAPRHALLAGGRLAEFSEWPLAGHVEVFGDIAHWWGSYGKSGLDDGRPTSGRGMKSIQFLRTADGWRIIAAAWDDERPGVPFPD